eukprot:4130047-Amphidinium_carterae.1
MPGPYTRCWECHWCCTLMTLLSFYDDRLSALHWKAEVLPDSRCTRRDAATWLAEMEPPSFLHLLKAGTNVFKFPYKRQGLSTERPGRKPLWTRKP